MRRLVIVISLLLLATPALARPGHHGPGARSGGPHFVEQHAEELGIDPTTLDEIRTIAEAHRADGQAIREQIHAVRRSLRDALHQPQPDETQVVSLAAELGALETQENTNRLLAMVRTRALLTVEQGEALLELAGRGYEGKREVAGAALVACEAEVANYCAEEVGPFRALRCLKSTEGATLSAECSDALTSLPERPMRQRGGRPGFERRPY